MSAIQQNIGSALGGAVDALGSGPLRAWTAALTALGGSEAARWQAMAQAGTLLAAELPRIGAEAFAAGVGLVAERQAAGRPPPAALELVRCWNGAAEAVMQRTLQSDEGLAVVAAFVRAGTASRQRINQAVAIASEAVNVPTRAEVDEAYRLIQQLRRDVRRLERRASA